MSSYGKRQRGEKQVQLTSDAYNLQNPPANGKQGLVSEEVSQTLVTNKKQGNNY
jgi:hypothetical protein